jgi:hypothetical protein
LCDRSFQDEATKGALFLTSFSVSGGTISAFCSNKAGHCTSCTEKVKTDNEQGSATVKIEVTEVQSEIPDDVELKCVDSIPLKDAHVALPSTRALPSTPFPPAPLPWRPLPVSHCANISCLHHPEPSPGFFSTEDAPNTSTDRSQAPPEPPSTQEPLFSGTVERYFIPELEHRTEEKSEEFSSQNVVNTLWMSIISQFNLTVTGVSEEAQVSEEARSPQHSPPPILCDLPPGSRGSIPPLPMPVAVRPAVTGGVTKSGTLLSSNLHSSQQMPQSSSKPLGRRESLPSVQYSKANSPLKQRPSWNGRADSAPMVLQLLQQEHPSPHLDLFQI